MKAAEALGTYVGVKPACDALRVARATFYRRRRPSTGHQQPRPTPARALSEKERDKVFDTLCSERFVDRSPAEVVATLLDEDVYLCSERTMYRVLASQVPVRERRAQRSHPEYQKPELMATGPGQVKWSYFYLKYTTMIANIVPCSAVMFRKACYYNVIRRILAVFTDSLLCRFVPCCTMAYPSLCDTQVGHNTCVNDRLRLSSWHG